jgi:hypothetical protein
MSDNQKSFLLLHFDINKTVLMADDSANRNMAETINSILSETILGYLPYDIRDQKV